MHAYNTNFLCSKIVWSKLVPCQLFDAIMNCITKGGGYISGVVQNSSVTAGMQTVQIFHAAK